VNVDSGRSVADMLTSSSLRVLLLAALALPACAPVATQAPALPHEPSVYASQLRMLDAMDVNYWYPSEVLGVAP